jgi:uncharacterized membrane protein YtjA (UPF0391 family)
MIFADLCVSETYDHSWCNTAADICSASPTRLRLPFRFTRVAETLRLLTGGRRTVFGNCEQRRAKLSESLMLHYAVIFFIIAIIAGVLGFGGIAVGAAGIAKVLFVVFLVGAVITLLVGRSRV